MNERLTDAEIRRSRLYCYLAAVVFAGCGAGVFLLPVEMSGAVRGVLAGFNAIIALAVFLYGRQLSADV